MFNKPLVSSPSHSQDVGITNKGEVSKNVMSGNESDFQSFISYAHASREKPWLDVLKVKELGHFLPNCPNLIIPYTNRENADYQQEIVELVNYKRIIISGRTGLGKSREAIELIHRLELTFGEEFSIFLIKKVSTDFSILSQILPSRNTILLIDDLHLYWVRFDNYKKFFNLTISFDEWIESLISYLEKTSPGHLWVIITLRTEPGLGDFVDYRRKPWVGFHVHNLKGISQTNKPTVVKVIAESLQLRISSEAISVLSSKCDGSFMSIISFFNKVKSQGSRSITEEVAKSFLGTYPLVWDIEYKNFIKPNKTFSSVFIVLSLYRKFGLTPELGSVIHLAGLFRGLSILGRVLIIFSIMEELKAWLEIETISSHGRNYTIVKCADAYLENFYNAQSRKHFTELIKFMLKSSMFMGERSGKAFSLLVGDCFHPWCEAYEFFNILGEDEDLEREINKLLKSKLDYSSLISLAFICLQTRNNELASSLIFRLDFQLKAAKIFNRITGSRSSISEAIISNIAYCLGYMTYPKAVPIILTTIDFLGSRRDRNDTIHGLSLFLDRLSLEKIFGAVAKWNKDDQKVYAGACLIPSYLSGRKSEEEKLEEKAIKDLTIPLEDIIPVLRANPNEGFNAINRRDEDTILIFIANPNERLRIRGYISAAFLLDGHKDILLKGLQDKSAKVRGIILLLLKYNTTLLDNSDVCTIKNLINDNSDFEGVTLSEVAKQVLENCEFMEKVDDGNKLSG